MWSIGNNGFPPDVRLVSQLIRILGKTRHLSLMVVFGEIDVRAHLAGPCMQSRRSMNFARAYLMQCQNLGKLVRAQRVVITVPVPPGDSFEDAPEFPRSGVLSERIDAFCLLRRALTSAVDSSKGIPVTVLLDCTDEMADSDGSIRADLTDDGCHVNGTGARIVRAGLRALPL